MKLGAFLLFVTCALIINAMEKNDFIGFSNSKSKDEKEEYLKEKMKESPLSENTYQMLRQKISECSVSDFSVAMQAEILKTIYEQASKNEDPKELSKMYANVISNYYDDLEDGLQDVSPEEKTKKIDKGYATIAELLDQQATVDYEGSMETLEYLINQECIERLGFFSETYAYPIKLLALLKKKKYTAYRSLAYKMVDKQLSGSLMLAFTQPKEMETLKDSRDDILSIDTLINTAAENILSDKIKLDNPSIERIDTILKVLLGVGRDYHTLYQEKIAKLLPQAIKKCPSSSYFLINLQSPSEALKKQAAYTLLEYIANPENKDLFWKREIISDLLKNGNKTLIKEGDLYRSLFQILKKSYDVKDFGTQLLIDHLKGKKDFYTLFNSIVKDYLQISNDCKTINEAFEAALQKKSLSLEQCSSLLSVAQKTKFQLFLDRNTVNQCKLKIILDETMSFKHRTAFLNDLLIDRFGNYTYDITDLKEKIKQLPLCSFRKYAHLLFIALDPTVDQTAHFTARAQLEEISNELLCEEPEILRFYFGSLYHAFDKWQREKASYTRVNPSFTNPFFPTGNSCFGIIINDGLAQYREKSTYRLYACDKDKGLPLWKSPFAATGKILYSIGRDWVYCAPVGNSSITYDCVELMKEGSNDNFVVLNKKTGQIISTVNLNKEGKIEQLYIVEQPNNNEVIYILYGDKLILANLVAETFKTIKLPEKAIIAYASLVAKELIIPTRKDFFIVASDGTTRSIPHESIGSLSLKIVGNDQFIGYQKHVKQDQLFNKIANDTLFVCLDAKTTKCLWEYPVDGIAEIEFSKDNSKVFILSGNALMALDTDPKASRRLIWEKKECNRFNFTSILPSADSSVLYGIKKRSELYQFDSKTGEDKLLSKSDYLGLKLVDIFNDKFYVQ